MADPFGVTLGLAILANLASHPLCTVLDSTPVRHLRQVCDDRRLKREFADAVNLAFGSLEPGDRRYARYLQDERVLGHAAGFELHKFFGATERPDAEPLARACREYHPDAPVNLAASFGRFIEAIETELRGHETFGRWIVARESGAHTESLARIETFLTQLAARPAEAVAPSWPRPLIHQRMPPLTAEFVERGSILDELHRALAGERVAALTQVHALHGLGGVGKTQAALAYAYHHRNRYALIWWIRAETFETMISDFAEIAAPLGGDPNEADQARVAADARLRLERYPEPSLLVFDNADDPAPLRALLPRVGHAHVLLTSRRTDWHGLAKAVEVGVMSGDEAIRLLTGTDDLAKLPEVQRAEAAALANDLGHLPLALAQARAYMRELAITPADYRADFAKRRAELLGDRPATFDYPASIAVTWLKSVEAARAACPAATDLLDLLAFFAPDPIPREVLRARPDRLPDSLRDDGALTDAIRALRRFSLLQADADTLTVHRLVQAVTRDRMDEATAKAWLERAVRLLSAATPFYSDDPRHWPAVQAILPHALRAAGEAEGASTALDAVGRIHNQLALYHTSRAAYAEAEPLYRRALAVGEKTLGPDHPTLAAGLNNLALLYKDTGRLTEAEPLYKRALAIGKKDARP